jgi:APA family basic amino acid/polyamine antiporter
MFGQSRIFFVMARDGLLPQRLSTISKRTGSPIFMTLITGVIVAVIAGLLPLSEIAAVANAGTLCAFIAVAVCMLVLRVRAPMSPRTFRSPLPWLVGIIAIAGCLYLFTSLSRVTIEFFFAWNAAGLAIYLLFARHKSALAHE